MKFLVLAALCLSAVWASPFKPAKGRIIGGDDARAGQFPYSAAIYYTSASGQFFCGGALISDEWIITSAHCVVDALQFRITLGSNHLQQRDPNRLNLATDIKVLHPKYNPQTLENDVGLIRLRMPITFSDYVQPAQLPTREVQPYAVVTSIGWGQISDEQPGLVETLRQVTVTALSNEECKSTFGQQVADTMVCVDGNFNQGICNGDMGGPLIQFVSGRIATVVGVGSFLSQNGCESTDPSGYSRVFPYLDWIKTIITEA